MTPERTVKVAAVDRLFDPGEPLVADITPSLSYGQRLTIRHATALAQGKHPANGLPIDTSTTCGGCANLIRNEGHSRTYLKCRFHRLGLSFSEASDIRAKWPGCPHWADREGDR
jgi:hypothetical protein